MRIGIDARMYGPTSTTGIGNYIKHLIDELLIIDQVNEYVLFMLEPEFSKFEISSRRVKKVKVDSKWYSWSEQLKLPKIYKQHQLDLLHVPHFNIPIFYSGKLISTIHDITPKFFPGPKVKKSPIRKWGYKVVFNRALKNSQKIITNSNHTKNEISKYFKINSAKIKVIYLGTNKQIKNQASEEDISKIKSKYRLAKSFILYIGVWRDHKNLVNLVKAFDIVRSKSALDLQLVLAGKPSDDYPEIFQAIKNSPYHEDIVKPGYVPDEELPAFYRAAKLFVLPSFCEGFGLVALESAFCGTPVVASKTTSVPEILDSAGKYFDPYSPEDIATTIISVLTNKDIYQALEKAGPKQADKFDWAECARQTLEVYQSS